MKNRGKPNMSVIDRWEFELACVRELSHSRAHPRPTVSSEQRRERIRSAIVDEKKARLRWCDTDLTYPAAYDQVSTAARRAVHRA